MNNVRSIDEEALIDELLAAFGEELRATGVTNFDLLERCPGPRQNELRAMMNAVALMHWATGRARSREQEASPVRARK